MQYCPFLSLSMQYTMLVLYTIIHAASRMDIWFIGYIKMLFSLLRLFIILVTFWGWWGFVISNIRSPFPTLSLSLTHLYPVYKYISKVQYIISFSRPYKRNKSVFLDERNTKERKACDRRHCATNWRMRHQSNPATCDIPITSKASTSELSSCVYTSSLGVLQGIEVSGAVITAIVYCCLQVLLFRVSITLHCSFCLSHYSPSLRDCCSLMKIIKKEIWKL